MKITEQGAYDIPEKAYHEDPAPMPSLSNTIAKNFINESPLHAWFNHPRLNPEFKRVDKTAFDLGRMAHALLLGEPENFAIVDAKAWNTNAAKDAKKYAYEAGKIPMLTHQFDNVKAMIASTHRQLAGHDEGAYFLEMGCRSEESLFWEEDGFWFRCRMDRVTPGNAIVFDFKTTGETADPETWGTRTLFNNGYDMQDAFYRRGFRAVYGVDPTFIFIVQDTKPPFALSVVTASGSTKAIGEAKVERAVAFWKWCMKHDKWPGYPQQTYHSYPPPWEKTKWLDENDNAHKGETKDLLEQMKDWQAPHEDTGQ